MQLFILTLGDDALDWFIELPLNMFDYLQSINDAFEDKYGNKEKVKPKVEETKEADNDLIEEFT